MRRVVGGVGKSDEKLQRHIPGTQPSARLNARADARKRGIACSGGSSFYRGHREGGTFRLAMQSVSSQKQNNRGSAAASCLSLAVLTSLRENVSSPELSGEFPHHLQRAFNLFGAIKDMRRLAHAHPARCPRPQLALPEFVLQLRAVVTLHAV